MMNAKAPTIQILIDDTGTARTINKRVKVRMIAEKHIYGKNTVEEIAEHYGISLADVYAALAYYHDNEAFYKDHDAKLKPLIEEGKRYSDELRAKIEARLTAKDPENSRDEI